MKDGRTHLAHKAEHAVDMDTGAIVAVTVQPADEGDFGLLVPAGPGSVITCLLPAAAGNTYFHHALLRIAPNEPSAPGARRIF
jgi:hypothetical protein